MSTGWGQRRAIVSGIGVFVAVAVAVLMALYLPPSIATPTAAPASSSGVVPYSVTPPTVSVHKDFAVTGASGKSAAFSPHLGDTIVVSAAVFGTNTVAITDSALDTYTTLYQGSGTSANGQASLWVFVTYNVTSSASRTITATLSGSSTDSAAVDVVDVTHVGPNPLDALGTADSAATSGSPDLAVTAVPATSSDLVLGFVAAHETRTWSAFGGDTVLNTEHAAVTGALLTGLDTDIVAASTGTSWVNASTARSGTYWMSVGLSLRPASSSATVTFTPSGLPSTSTWYVAFGSNVSSSTGGSITFNASSGVYPYLVGPISGLTETPSSGDITVSGTTVTQTVVFAADTSDWPTYLGEVSRNSNNFAQTTLSPADVANLTQLWSASTGYGQTEPVESQGVVYDGGINGNEYAINATTGKVLWTTYIGQVTQPNCDPKPTGITSSATVFDGVVYVGGGNTTGNLTNGTANWFALDAATGKIDWQLPIGYANQGYYNWASPLIADGNAYIGVSSRCDEPLVWAGLLQVSLTTHHVIGFFNTTVGNSYRGASIWGSPSFDAANNTIYVATGNPLKNHTTDWSESVIAINATTLAPLGSWQVPQAQVIKDSDFGTTPGYFHLPDGMSMVTAINKNGYYYAFNASNLTAGPVWEQKISYTEYPANVDPAAWGGGLVYIGSSDSNINGKNYSASIRAIDPTNGSINWIRGLSSGVIYGAPVYSNGVLAVASGPKLDVFNAANGDLLWNWSCSSSFNSAPSIANGRLYAECTNTYAFGLTGVLHGPVFSGPAAPQAHGASPNRATPTVTTDAPSASIAAAAPARRWLVRP